jgi:HD-GYP domain-containing protein (c-di-GMP phosphodiesterase class II)
MNAVPVGSTAIRAFVEPAPLAGIVSLSEIVSALSFALDLVEDAHPGHAIRCCLLGLRIARRLGLSEGEQADLYYALLLKDAGCSSNARLVCDWVGGDDRVTKREGKMLDWTKISLASIRWMWRNAPTGASTWERLRRLAAVATHPEGMGVQFFETRCERGAQIARKIGMNPATAEAIRSLDEHWNGLGQPERLLGEAIPLFSRILNIAQNLDVFAIELGRRAAMVMLRERSGSWFDPALVNLVEAMDADGSLWQDFGSGREREIVLANEPGHALLANDDHIDRIVEAFADIVDAKSSFTYRHSVHVSQYTVAIAKQMGLPANRTRMLYRAAMLHDLGKLRVPNTVLDKPGKLTPEEWTIVQEHPGLTRQILERISHFAELAVVAGNHHEKLDGTGYPAGLRADQLSLDSRILTLADIFGSLTELRPYREPMPIAKAVAIVREQVPAKLDEVCFEALLGHLRETGAL